MDNGAQIPKTVRRSPLEKRIVFKLQVKRIFSISPLCVEAAQGALTQRVDEQAAIDNGPLCGALERGAAAMVSNGRVVRWARGAVCAAAFAAAAFTLPVAQAWAAGDVSPELRSQTQTQMSSAPEIAYVSNVSDPSQRTVSFNDNWKFNLGDASGAQAGSFDDSSWQYVTLPHDYSIDQDYASNLEAESAYKPGGIGWYRKSFFLDSTLAGKQIRIDFDGVYMDATVWVNGTELGNHPYGYTPFSFDLTPYLKTGEENTIAVKVNHQVPSSRWYSGSGIGRNVDLVVTDKVSVTRDGVHVSAPQLQSENGGNVTTKLSSTIVNNGDKDANVTLVQTIFPKGGKVEQAIGTVTTDAQAVAAGESKTIESQISAANPSLWSTESPNLYTVRTDVKVDDKVVDTYDTVFGYRWFNYDVTNGFSLNGKNVKLKGVCMHHDQGALGSVDSRAAVERQVRILKEMGCNSIRTSHNTPSRVLVEVCEEQGILLDEEIFDGWTDAKNGNSFDYARFFNKKVGDSKIIGAKSDQVWAEFDLKATIARDFNSPSVIMWSVGNEMITGGTKPFDETAQLNLIKWTKEADTSRPVTLGDNQLKGGSWNYHPDNLANAGGLIGINYADGSRYDQLHANNPSWKFYGSETVSSVNSRGVYNTLGSMADAGGHQLTSYDTSYVSWGHTASQAWYDTITRDFVAGEYVWTGFDYLGEPTPWNGVTAGVQGGDWSIAPKNSYFGIIDTAGLPKDTYYLYQSQWNDNLHTLHILPAWKNDMVKKDGSGKVKVVVYTDAAGVELFFTPKGSTTPQSLGKKTFTKKTTAAGYTYQIYEGEGKSGKTAENLWLSWNVPYADGTITAKAYDENGNVVSTENWDGRQSVTTTGAAAKLDASVDRADLSGKGDLAYVTVSVKDQNGNIVPDAKNNVKFKVSGAGELAGIDNGSSPDHQSYRDNNRNAWAGQLVGIVRSNGKGGDITVTVTADGLDSKTVTISSTGSSDPAAPKSISSLLYSRFYYVKTGSELSLPKQVDVNYSDGTSEKKDVAWDNINKDALSKPGTFQVSGEVEGAKVSCTVTVLDEVAALLNYSATTPVGTAASLPDARPAAMADGTVLNASFPVTWETPAEDAYNKAGTVTVKGTANVFGKDLAVTATIRVQNEKVTIGDNVANCGALMSVTQDVPENKQSDSLNAINDGVTAFTPGAGDGSANTTCWSNYAYAQEGNTKSSVTFNYNTQQRLGRAVVYFVEDSWSASYPDAGTTKVEVSEDGNTWREVTTTETIGSASNRVKPYTYEFEPTLATFVRFTFTNKNVTLPNAKPCTCITEIQLFEAKGSFDTNTEATLDSLTVNGKKLSASNLEKGSYSTAALFATVDAVPAKNTAVTVLPAHDNKINIILESEDHATRKTFVINLAADSSSSVLPDDNDERDVPNDDVKNTAAGSELNPASGNEGPVSFAFDKNNATYFHTNWRNGFKPRAEDLWVSMELKEATSVEALRYLPRNSGGDGGYNGIVTDYEIQYRENESDEWKPISTGRWKGYKDEGFEMGWRVAQFDHPVTAKYFRFKANGTQAASGDNEHMSAAEIRLRKTSPAVEIKTEQVAATDALEVANINDEEDIKAQIAKTVEVTVDGEKLTYGLDYKLGFEMGDVSENGRQVTVTVTGIEDYTGSVDKVVNVTETKPTLEGIAVNADAAKRAYAEGDKLDPTGLVLTLSYSNGTTDQVEYSESTKNDFTFNPSLDTELTENGNLEVTVTYGGKSNSYVVTVSKKAPTDPDKPKPEQPNPDQPKPEQPGGGNLGGNGNQGNTGNTGNKPDASTKPGASGKPGKGNGVMPGTGDSTLIAVAMAGFAGVAAIAWGIVARKRRQN